MLNEPEFSEYRASIEQQRQQVGTGAGRGRRYVSDEEAMLQYAIYLSIMEQRGAAEQPGAPGGQQGSGGEQPVVSGELSAVDAALLVPDELDENALLQQAIAASLSQQQAAGTEAAAASGGGAANEATTPAEPGTGQPPAPGVGAPPQIAGRPASRHSGRNADEEQLKLVLELSMACSFIKFLRAKIFNTLCLMTWACCDN